jgi:hypothetical protein
VASATVEDANHGCKREWLVAAGGTGGLALRQLAGMEAWGASGTGCGLGQAQEAADVQAFG